MDGVVPFAVKGVWFEMHGREPGIGDAAVTAKVLRCSKEPRNPAGSWTSSRGGTHSRRGVSEAQASVGTPTRVKSREFPFGAAPSQPHMAEAEP